MKKNNIIFWIITGLFAAFMLSTSIPDVLSTPEAVTIMNQLGYPKYFTPFIGVAKILGIIAILIPGFPRIKEWAYAGLMYDLLGATYSNMMVAPGAGVLFMILPISFEIVSYVYYHKRLKASLLNK